MKKIISVLLVCIITISSFAMVTQAAGTVNVTVTAPRIGASPNFSGRTSTALYYVSYIEWLELCPGDSEYHYMSSVDTFESGNKYRVLVVIEPNPNAAGGSISVNQPITINGKTPTYQQSWAACYDFGTLGGYSGGSSTGGGITFWDILLFPIFLVLEILSLPFRLIGAIFS